MTSQPKTSRAGSVVFAVVLALIVLGYFMWRAGAGTEEGPGDVGTISEVADQQAAPRGSSTTARRPAATADVIAIPANYQFAGISGVAIASTTDELLSRYTPEQQERIRAFYSEFGEGPFNLTEYAVKDIFSFRTAGQLRWLLLHGYPSPDDVLAASAMSDAELAEMADAGNFKAISFYLERLDHASEAIPTSSNGNFSEVKHRAQLEDKVLATGSPFSAYVMARRAIAEKQPGMALAAYFYAGRLGDGRGRDFAQHLGGVQDVDAREAVISYMALQARAATHNPQLNDPRYLARTPTFPKWN